MEAVFFFLLLPAGKRLPPANSLSLGLADSGISF
jgi:hypothetical protein